MPPRLVRHILHALLLTLAAAVPAQAQPDPARLEKQRAPRPAELAIVFSFGYGGDRMPQDDAQFEKLLSAIKAAGFNTIQCTCTAPRLELCRKHGVKMMVDLLADQHHVYKSADKAQAVCAKLRGDTAVWGYHLWSDTFAKTGPGASAT